MMHRLAAMTGGVVGLAMGLTLGLTLTTSAFAQTAVQAGWTPNPSVVSAFQDAIAAAPLNRRLAERRDAYLIGETVWGDPTDHDDDDRLLAELRGLTIEADRALPLRLSSGDLADGCVDIRLRGCASPMGGYLNLAREDEAPRRLFWQVQEGFTPEDGVQAGWVLLEADGDRLAPIMWDFGGAFYTAPVAMGRDDQGRELIALPGRNAGTGNHNADVVLAWTPGDGGGRWAEIETWSWRDHLENQLPAGLEIWKGVDFDWPNLMATTALWRPDDGNCCPTGGSAVLTFEIVGDRLTLTEARVSPAS